MTKNQFTNLIRKSDNSIFTGMAIEKDGTLIPIKRIGISSNDKKIFFHSEDNKIVTSVEKRNISDVEQLKTSRDDFDYSLLITTKNGKNIKLHINMKYGYSLYAYTDEIIDKYKSVAESISKYLDKFVGGNVSIKHSINNSMYRTFSEEENTNVIPVTESYVICNFDYIVFYNEIAPNIPNIKMFSKDNNNTYSCAMGVDMITDEVISIADGQYILNIME